MPEKIKIELGEVQQTLFLPLWGRAQESSRAHPVLVDRAAQALIERLDYDFAGLAKKISPLSRAAWIMRALTVDRVIREFLLTSPQGTIINLGCGLDTTFERVDNGELTWYDLDLPDVIALRSRLIPQSERRHFIAGSLLEPEWLQQVHATGRVLVVAAGVLYYSERKEIRHFLVNLSNRFSCEVRFDVCSPYGVRVANQRVIHSSGLGQAAELKWGVRSANEIARWDARFRLLKTYNYFGWNASGLPLNLRLFGLLSDALKVQYMVHLGL